jgi:hypothetical protein
MADVDIQHLLAAHAQRKRVEEETRVNAEAEQQRAKSRCVELLKAVVAPALRAVAEQIDGDGYRSEVRERLDGREPSVSLAFAISGAGVSTESELEFQYTGPDCLSVTAFVQSGKPYRAERQWPSETLSVGKVKAEAVSFVQAVLAADLQPTA